ncbi:type II CRISPR RNA-guided endonuclease Cas9 [Pueribacillus theae]|uniref:CRISPR-associated endonuclease Cas9 n=1 Tax=Pueribacillus theae TaxID=2171751 RepID=A0A2U1JYI5_9BACI|nr:type II CRISPR RNA-guided endonuclease Cas9 [Pueribacillus theae]PWA10009.1 type II CRISPR RNA-guided endonuclease Cas9 [Pueribacillus theae]
MRYHIGLDIGVTSVGWAVINLDKERIENLGVRMFEVAENPKDGSSLAAPRREARSVRRRLRRRKYRVSRVRHFIIKQGLLTKVQAESLYDWQDGDLDIWLLRVNALERKLEDREFARILIHCAKHRGFKSNRKSETKETENGLMLSSVKENQQIMKEKNYKTIAQLLVYETELFDGRKRNRSGQYTHVFARDDLENEIKIIFEKQREFGHPFATKENEQKYLNIWSSQRPFASKEAIMSKVGDCSLIKGEKRAPKFSYQFERFRALDKLNRLRILSIDQPGRKLSEIERELALDLLFDKKEVKYSDLRKALSLDESARFNELFYDESKSVKENEKVVFISLEGQYKIKSIIKGSEGKTAVLEYRPVDYDTIAYALTVFKDDQDIKDYLKNEYVDSKGKKLKNLANRVYSDALIEGLLGLSFSKFSHLSLKALKELLVHMEAGYSYTEACELCGYTINQRNNMEKSKLLPVIPGNEIRNPVVLRSLSQSRKVINAIIKRYGSPSGLYIELARDMGRPYNERSKISKEYNANRLVNDKARSRIQELHPSISDPRGHDILKYKLWEEQNGKCAYSLEPITIERLFEPGYAEVDHIIPYSRSFDDSNQNKVLVLGRENQNKQNRTPFEWFGHDEKRWEKFISYVSSLKVGRKKKSLLLKTAFDEEQEEAFRARNLNDTRYTTRFLKNFIEENLQFREEKGKKQYVYTVNGAYTSLMRKRWGFNKNREENDLHHALDAAIVAVSHDNYHKVSAFFKRKEISTAQLLKREKEQFPEPWEGFSKELEARLLQNPLHLKMALESLASDAYDEQFINEVKPIFVSRMPKRGVKGQLHEKTFRRQRGENDKGYTVVVTKTGLDKITFDKNGDFPMYGKESDPRTYNAIKERYLAYGKDKKKAFAEPLYKPSKNPEKAPIIRSVKIEDKRNLFVALDEKTAADNASIARTDVFQHRDNGKYYLIPIYVSDVKEGRVPNRFITQNKPYNDWLECTEDYQFKFSLYPNDLIHVKLPQSKQVKLTNKEEILWQENFFYYKKVDVASGQITIMSQEGSLLDRIGVQRLVTFDKYQVDPLGNIKKVNKETRHGV